jgi:hypothetical protein
MSAKANEDDAPADPKHGHIAFGHIVVLAIGCNNAKRLERFLMQFGIEILWDIALILLQTSVGFVILPLFVSLFFTPFLFQKPHKVLTQSGQGT